MNSITVIQLAEKAIINKDLSILKNALSSLSKIIKRNDPNDIITDLSIIHHTASKLGLDSDEFLLSNKNACSEELQQFIDEFLSREPKDKTIKSMGYKELSKPTFKYVFSSESDF